MTAVTTDIFIIGGGINGAGIAADAAGRGLSVTLVEQNDLASGTSSMSSKLIHGGLRYLATYDFSLVRKALQEREILLRKAPHIITPLEFVLPHAKHLRPAWLIRIGLFIYDHLAAHPLLPDSHKIDLREDARGKPLLSEITTGFSYYDCFDDDARLVVLNALDAQSRGANIMTRTECTHAEYKNQRWEIHTTNLLTTENTTHYAKVLVNAAGPWIAQLQEKAIQTKNPFTVELIKGSHIVVPKLYDGDFAYILQNPDERVVFAIPYENDFTLIGTTDVPYTADITNINSSAEEEIYLCETVARYFKKTITPHDIVWSYAGVRCLQEDNAKKASEITRDYKFELNEDVPLLTVISGKITTYRCLAEEAINALKKFFPQLLPAWTADSPLPGGDFINGDFEKFYQKVTSDFNWLPAALARRYAKNYGTRIYLLLENTHSMTELGKCHGGDLYQKEIDYLIKHEWATTAEDIMWRRTKQGLFLQKEEQEKLTQVMQKLFS